MSEQENRKDENHDDGQVNLKIVLGICGLSILISLGVILGVYVF